MHKNILITGAFGQLGTVLVDKLAALYGKNAVLATDIRKTHPHDGPFEMLDVLNVQRMREIIGDYNIKEIYHLAAILSASGEWNPLKTWNINLNGYLSLLDLAKEMAIEKVFYPSTIAVFGPTTPKVRTPQDSPMLPQTVYGMSKLSGEQWGNYYFKRYGLDVRSVRFPGIIGHQSLPGGGTTDYAIDIFHSALKESHYQCFLEADTRLPMIYMDDAIRAIVELMEAPVHTITIRSSYNLAGVSFTPAEIASEIQSYIPGFTTTYVPDFRQKIAESWTESIDDSPAKKDWGWQPVFGLKEIVKDMMEHLAR